MSCARIPGCRALWERLRFIMSDDVLAQLSATIKARRAADAGKSYTKKLLEAGIVKCAKKLGEEAAETVIAAVGQGEDELKAEAADLLYHLLVVLECRGVALEDVLDVLSARVGTSGLDEKKSRSKK